MWSFTHFSQPSPRMGDSFGAGQKRELNFHCGNNVSIVHGKSFQNPNFVNKHHPFIHNYDIIQSSVRNNCHIDIESNVSDNSATKNKSLINSSQSILQTLKEKHLDTVKDSEEVDVNPRVRKNRRRKIPNKCSKQNYRQVINDMMEIDVDPEAYMDASDTNMSLKAPNTLAEFIIDIPYKSDSNSISDEEDLLATIISVSPPNKGPVGLRERQLSVAESEDSFIIFDSGTDEELEFSEGDSELSEGESELSEGESEDETESEFQDDFDSSSSSVIPCKRVRFAENDDLCEVHPMVQWSFAYRSARKGPWEEYARDRARFIKRITQTEEILAPIFDHKHREKMYKERFQEQNIN